jgi:hypothetical protein
VTPVVSRASKLSLHLSASNGSPTASWIVAKRGSEDMIGSKPPLNRHAYAEIISVNSEGGRPVGHIKPE